MTVFDWISYHLTVVYWFQCHLKRITNMLVWAFSTPSSIQILIKESNVMLVKIFYSFYILQSLFFLIFFIWTFLPSGIIHWFLYYLSVSRQVFFYSDSPCTVLRNINFFCCSASVFPPFIFPDISVFGCFLL